MWGEADRKFVVRRITAGSQFYDENARLDHDRNLYGLRPLNSLARGGAQHLQTVEGLGHDPAATLRQGDQALAQTGEVLLDDAAPDRALSPVAILKRALGQSTPKNSCSIGMLRLPTR